MAAPYQVVANQFAQSTEFAASAQDYAQEFVANLNEMAQAVVPPAFDAALTPPTEPTPGAGAPLSTLQNIVFEPAIKPADAPNAPTISSSYPSAPLAPTLPEIELPTIVLPSAPASPVLNLSVAAVAVPVLPTVDAPTLIEPIAPVDISVAYPSDPDSFDTTYRLLQPTPYSYAPSAKYSTALLEEVRASIAARLNGGTGLDAEVEAAIWNRGRSRELKTTVAARAEVLRSQEARGFSLPPGAAVAQDREATRDYYGKVSELSRDIAIKQAELEQVNAQKTIEQGMAMEGRLIEYANQTEQRAFESARVLAENAVAIYNAQINELQNLVAAHNANATVFRAKIELQQTRVEVFKAQVQAFTAKFGANSAKVELYRARLQASESIVNLYRAQLEGNKTLVEIEQVRAQVFGEQIRGFTAQINGEVAKLEAPKVQAQVQNARADLYKAQVDGYAAAAGVESTRAKTQVEVYQAQISAFAARWQGYAAQVAGEGERVKALASVNSSLIERDKLALQRDVAQFQQASELFRTRVSFYEAQMRINFDKNKVMSDQYFAVRGIAADAAKVGAQVNAQLAASAYSTLHVSASVSGDDRVSWNYAGKIASPANPG
jgi:hypothetical protein